MFLMSRFSRSHPRISFVVGTLRFLARYALTLGSARRKRNVLSSGKEYADLWKSRGDSYVAGDAVRPQMLNGAIVRMTAAEHRAFFLRSVVDEIERVRPQSVLELGSGLGVNLLALAALCPSVSEWTGVELTPEGVTKAKELVLNPPYEALQKLTGKTRAHIEGPLRKARFSFVQGDMTALPFRDDSFDLVFSLWALEQLPKAYPQALREAFRVTRGPALFLEAFREAQDNLFQLVHLWRMDYFRASYRSVKDAGFTVREFKKIPLSKIKFNNAVLTCVK
ncbi:MAG: class I SAM-dependent methyltransferase [bacterium]|nr:class I SAM-dependent methyltransferase [bacterium]